MQIKMKSSGVENMFTLFQNINEGTFFFRYTSDSHHLLIVE